MILLVEDDARIRTDFAETLRFYGYELIEAEDGIQALLAVDQHGPDIELVVTDLVLPRLNGLMLMAAIQAKYPELPMIVVSAYLSQSGGEKVVRGRAVYLEKPFTATTFIGLVHSIIPRAVN